MKTNIQTIKEKVEQIMLLHPESRNNDTLLTILLWGLQGARVSFKNIQQTDLPLLKILSSPETIIRVRRLIQNNEHRLMPTRQDVIEKRGLREKMIRVEVGR